MGDLNPVEQQELEREDARGGQGIEPPEEVVPPQGECGRCPESARAIAGAALAAAAFFGGLKLRHDDDRAI